MSAIINSITDFVQGVETGVGNEVTSIASRLDSVISTFASNLSAMLELRFSQLESLRNTAKADITGDLAIISTTLTTLVGQGETAIEGVFQDAVKQYNTITDGIQALSLSTINSIEGATKYLRKVARNDLINAVSDSKNSLNTVESNFKTAVSGYANDFIAFVEGEIAALVASGQTDLASIQTLKNNILGDFQSAIDDIKNDL